MGSERVWKTGWFAIVIACGASVLTRPARGQSDVRRDVTPARDVPPARATAPAPAPVTPAPPPRATPPAASPAPASPKPKTELDLWLATQRDPLGRSCEKLAVESVDDRFAIACGSAGLWIARRDAAGGLVLLRTDDFGGPVVGLFVREGNVWAELVRTEARPVSLGPDVGSSRSFPVDTPAAPPVRHVAPAHLAAPSPETVPATPRKREGHVVEVMRGEVVIDLGRRDGIRFGESIELSVLRTEEVGTEHAVERNVIAVGEVTTLSPGFSRVKLGIGERVPMGALARVVADEPTATRVGPPRLGGLWEIGFMARPFVALNDLGGGVLLEGSVGYRFEGDFHLEAAVQPLGFGTGADKPGVAPVGAYLKASYDLPLFEAGFGIGAETVYNVDYGTEPGTGTLFVQQLRFGAVDGLKVDVMSRMVLFHSRFDFSGLVGSSQFPVGQTSWLLFRGGGGGAGFAFGELGVRALLVGNGDRGSVFFTGTLGGLGVFETETYTCKEPTFEYPCTNTVTYAGPMLGAGAEWRL